MYDFEHAPYKKYVVSIVKRFDYYGTVAVEARDAQEAMEIAEDQAMDDMAGFDEEEPNVSYVVQDVNE